MDNLTFLHTKAVERASDDDRAWFEANPGRSMRLRDSIPMEFNGPLPPLPSDFTHRTITVQVHEGARSRCPIGLLADVPNDGATDDDIDELLRRYGPPGVYEQTKELARHIRKAKSTKAPKPGSE